MTMLRHFAGYVLRKKITPVVSGESVGDLRGICGGESEGHVNVTHAYRKLCGEEAVIGRLPKLAEA